MDMLRLLSGDATPLHGVAGKGAADLMRDLIDSGAGANAATNMATRRCILR